MYSIPKLHTPSIPLPMIATYATAHYCLFWSFLHSFGEQPGKCAGKSVSGTHCGSTKNLKPRKQLQELLKMNENTVRRDHKPPHFCCSFPQLRKLVAPHNKTTEQPF